MKVLVVDDEPLNSRLFELLINQSGRAMAVVFEGEPEQLLELETYQGFDAVLLDLMMPRISGAAAAAFIRQQCPDMKIVVLTALSRHQLPKDLDVDVVLAKPTPSEQILEALGVK